MSTPSTRQRGFDFLEACKIKDCHTVRQFILSGCDPILIRNECGQNALHVASLHGNMDVVELLVKVYGCNPAITDHEGRTALHLACMGGSIVVTNYLMKMVNCHLKDKSDNTILHCACLSGDISTLRYVMDAVAEQRHISNCKLNIYKDKTTTYFNGPNISEYIALENRYGETALHTACRAGHLNVIQCLVEELECDPCLCHILTSVSKLACQYGRNDIFTHLIRRECSHTSSVLPTKASNATYNPPAGARQGDQHGLFFLSPKLVISSKDTRQHNPPHHACPSQNRGEECKPLPSFKHVSSRARVLIPSLRLACQAGNEKMVRHLIEDYKCNPLLPDSDTGDTPLHFACVSGNVSLVSFLLDRQCDPMKCNKQGNLPLHEACMWGNLEIVEKLVAVEPSALNAHNQMMETPLHLACSRNRIHIGKLLVGIDSCGVMALNNLNETPLHVASCSSDYELIECILNKGSDALKCMDNYDDTPLFNACRVGNVKIVKLFVDAGCDALHVNKKTHELPIHIACRTGNVALFQYLKKSMKTESWNQANIFGQTPLHLVCERGNLPLVNDILELAACDLSLKDNRGMTPLHIACKRSDTNVAKVILAGPTFDINIEDEDGNTPLHLACVTENSDIITLLMQHQPNVTIRNKNGDTPIHVASKYERFEILCKVLGTKSDNLKFEFNNAGVTPLHIASSNGDYGTVKYLVNGNYCDPNATSKQENCTPLHFACFEGHKDIAVYLVQCAPRTIKVCDVNGQCPLVLALRRKNLDVIKSLVPQYFDPISGVSEDSVPFFLYACKFGDVDLLKYLVSDAKCSLTIAVPQWGTPLHYIVEHVNPLEDNVLLYVLGVCSSQIDCVDDRGNTPLLLACNLAKNNVVPLLLEHKANPNCCNSEGDSPLHVACRLQMCDVVETLLHYKANVTCKNNSRNTPLHIALRYRKHKPHTFPFDYSITDLEKSSYDIIAMLLKNGAGVHSKGSDGDTPLHIASRSGLTTLVKLLIDYEADVFCKDAKEKTPIQVTTSYDVTMMLIDYGANPQDVYTHYGEILETCRKEQPLHELVKILIVGNALTGKTTLVEALKTENITLIENVKERTAGIVSTQFRNDKLGNVTFHDFAGQQEFYSSHSPFLVDSLSSHSIVLLLVNALDEDSELEANVSYWMSFIKYHCKSTECLPQTVVICSHVDKLDGTKAEKMSALKRALQKHQCIESLFLDCRDPASECMHQLKNLLGDICGEIRINMELDCQCHVLFAFMHSRLNSTIVELCAVQNEIKKTRKKVPPRITKKIHDPGDLLPHAALTLLSLLQHLHQKGHIILLNDKSHQGEHWIVLKQEVFYEKVHGILFAPEKKGLIRTNVGIVPLSTLKLLFFENVDIVTEYLVYKEFCHRIHDTQTLQLISNDTKTLNKKDELYFFPSFVDVKKPIAVWEPKKECYCSGWCLQCSGDQFFPTNFLHVLLLRLTFKYAVQRKDVSPTSHLIRRCDVWKNGIHWFTKEGVEVLVELTHNFTFLLVLIRSVNTKPSVNMECVKLRASVIKTVFEVMKKACPGLKPCESLIHHGLHDYPDCDLISAEKTSIQEIAESIKEGNENCFSSKNELLNIEDNILFFEPYSGIREHLLPLLYASDEKEIPSNHVLELSECFSDRKEKLAYVLNVSPVDMGDIKAHPVCQKNPELIPHRVIEHWKISTRRGSYSDLREAFDKYSIFNGRNLLTLCN